MSEPGEPGEPVAERATGPVPEFVAALADASSTAADEPEPAATAEPAPEPTPESDSRVRLRALTGGLADLSDALAAIGVESVAAPQFRPGVPAFRARRTVPGRRLPRPLSGLRTAVCRRLRCPLRRDRRRAEANRYLFTCPACGARVRRPAGPELAEILKSAGVATLALRRGPGQAL